MRTRSVTVVLTRAFIAIVLVVALFPIAWMISISFRPNGEVFSVPPRWIPEHPTAAAYSENIKNAEFMRYMANSYVIAVAVSIGCIALAIPAAYAFSRYAFMGKRLAELFVVSTQMIPPVVLVIPYFGFLLTVHLENSLFGLAVTYVSFALPFSVLMTTRYVNTIPRELDESAQIDGASKLRTLSRIILPLTRPGLVATAIYSFMLSWNEFLLATTLLQDNQKYTFPIGVALQVGDTTTRWDLMMAYAFLGTLPILVGFLFMQKHLVAGMLTGSLRG